MTRDEFKELTELLLEDWITGNYDRVSQLICNDAWGAGRFQQIIPTLELIQESLQEKHLSTRELARRRAFALLSLFNPEALTLASE